MIRTVEATIDEKGLVSLLKPIRLSTRHRAFVTILDEAPSSDGDLAPARTNAELAAAHHARAAALANGANEYVSIDLPVIDDGADW